MMQTWEDVEAAAMKLSEEERARLARRLIASLDDDKDEDPVVVEAAWAEEIEHRVREYRDGRVHSLWAEDVLAEARDRLQ